MNGRLILKAVIQRPLAIGRLSANVRCQVDEREDSESAERRQWVDLGHSRSTGPFNHPERPESAQAVSKVRWSAYTDQNTSLGVPYDAFR